MFCEGGIDLVEINTTYVFQNVPANTKPKTASLLSLLSSQKREGNMLYLERLHFSKQYSLKHGNMYLQSSEKKY